MGTGDSNSGSQGCVVSTSPCVLSHLPHSNLTFFLRRKKRCWEMVYRESNIHLTQISGSSQLGWGRVSASSHASKVNISVVLAYSMDPECCLRVMSECHKSSLARSSKQIHLQSMAMICIRTKNFGARQNHVQIPPLPLLCCVTSFK